MVDIQGFHNLREIYQGKKAVVYRGQRQSDGQPVALKFLREECPTLEEVQQTNREYEILLSLAGKPGVIKTYEISKFHNSPVLVLEDIGAESLRVWLMKGRRFSLKEVLSIGAAAAAALGEIHAARVIHKDINPGNILYNPENGAVRIIDFSIASVLSLENPQLQPPEHLEGTLSYISPEQTGRMNRLLDFRTDFYSLGATLYELLTDQPPFATTDPLELVHCHIAKLPVACHELHPEIPQVVSAIVMKLLSKNAERRYRSALGIKVDLEECLRQLRRTTNIQSFALGRKDVSDRLMIPQKLFGRKDEIEALLAGFERVSQGKKELVLVAGPSGIGKTSLVQEVHRPMTRKQAFYLAGKFDALRRDTPYTAFVGAFRQLAQQLLTEPKEKLRGWREKVLSAVGINGQVLVEMVPELALFLGEQTKLVQLPATEAQNRFRWVIQKFLEVFARPEHPLILFLDDLQWADSASLGLLNLLMTSEDIGCLCLIGAYRDNEVSDTHPLVQALAQIQKNGAVVQRISLSPLGLADVQELLSDTLQSMPDQTVGLATLLVGKTQGNPFFLSEFLRTLSTEGLLWFETASSSWHWELTRIEGQQITDNVVTLLEAKIQRLDDETKLALKQASCFGSQFELSMLAKVSQRAEDGLQKGLVRAVEAGMVLSVNPSEYRFSHARVQQAAYSLLSEPEKTAIHGRIGQHLAWKYPKEKDDGKIFELTNQLNLARAAMVDPALRESLARWNLQAGIKAKNSAAYGPAFDYLKIGLELLSPADWTKQYDLNLTLHEEAAEAAYLSGRFEETEKWIQEALDHARVNLDKVKIFQIRIHALLSKNQCVEAIQAGLEILAQLGIPLPEHPTKPRLVAELIKTRLALWGKTKTHLAALPPMDNPRVQAAIQIMRTLAMPLYISNMELMALLLFMQVRLLLKYGHNIWSASIFNSFGLVCCGLLQAPKQGYQYGLLAQTLFEKHPSRSMQCRVMFAFNNYIKHWREPLGNTLQPFLQGYQAGIQTGDFEYASLCAFAYCVNCYIQGMDLDELSRACESYASQAGKLNQPIQNLMLRTIWQTVENLQGRAADPSVLKGSRFDEGQARSLFLETKNKIAEANLLFSKATLCCLFQRYPEAVAVIQQIDHPFFRNSALVVYVRVVFLNSMAWLGMYGQSSRRERTRILQRVLANQKKMKQWAKLAPENYRHLWALIEAGRLRVQDHWPEAEAAYAQAISLSQEHKFLADEAMAHEHLGELLLAQNDPKSAKIQLIEARNAYLRWGAKAKVEDIDQKHGEWLGKPRLDARVSATQSTRTAHTSTKESTESFDFVSIIKASQSISGEIVLANLLGKLMQLVAENAGAEKCFLIMETSGELRVEASMKGLEGQKAIVESKTLEGFPDLPERIVRYVFRSNSTVILGDAANEGNFTQDPYVEKNRPHSILCMPIQHHKTVSGVLYLENNQSTDVFTPSRVEVLGVLTAQAAISLENAKLYSRLGESMVSLEEALAKAQESGRLKDEFLAKTSHELRTPLNAIINIPVGLLAAIETQQQAHCQGCGTVFQLEPGERIDAQTRCLKCQEKGLLEVRAIRVLTTPIDEIELYLQTTINQGRHLLGLVNDVLDLSSMADGRISLKLEEVSVKEALAEVILQTQYLATQRSTLITVPEASSEWTLLADRARLIQILGNLVMNAIKFSPKNGRVEVGMETVMDKLTFWVKDHGIGIAKEDLELIFDGFRQVDGGATRKYGGMGVGLAITRNLVEMHQGDIWAESEPGQGSTFFVRLPRRQPGQQRED